VPDPLRTNVGLNVLHLFARVGEDSDGKKLTEAVANARSSGVQLVSASLVGHRADIALVGLSDDIWLLRQLQTEVSQAWLDITYSYVSVTEVSEYAAGVPEELKQARLFPNLPPEGKRAFCFYPMSKRRGEDANWYRLPYSERESLMMGHGRIGRTFAGRVLQLVTASTGLDDFEWGVTLFAESPDTLKECVYSMRFDEASALYAEFGPFLSGSVGTLEEVMESVGL
jgi:peroxiredoxin